MKKAEFLQMVLEELDTIKSKATKEEIGRLDFKSFSSIGSTCCIYGQMTGYCYSQRAENLIPKKYRFLTRVGSGLIDTPFSKHSFEKGNIFTALEKYLLMVESTIHKQIIQYLKGEIKEIELK